MYIHSAARTCRGFGACAWLRCVCLPRVCLHCCACVALRCVRRPATRMFCVVFAPLRLYSLCLPPRCAALVYPALGQDTANRASCCLCPVTCDDMCTCLPLIASCACARHELRMCSSRAAHGLITSRAYVLVTSCVRAYHEPRMCPSPHELRMCSARAAHVLVRSCVCAHHKLRRCSS